MNYNDDYGFDQDEREDTSRSEVSATSSVPLRIQSGSWTKARPSSTGQTAPTHATLTSDADRRSEGSPEDTQPMRAAEGLERFRHVTTPPRDTSRAESKEDKIPWSPGGQSPGFFPALESHGECTHSPNITPLAKRRQGRTGDEMHRDGEMYSSRRKEKEQFLTSGLFQPDTSLEGSRFSSRMYKMKPVDPVFTRLYESRNKTNLQEKVAMRLREESAECRQPVICASSANLVPERSAEMRLHWNEEKKRRLIELREHEQQRETSGMQSPSLNPNSLALANRNRRGRVEDRLISFGNKIKTERLETEIHERIKNREEANPHISAHAAMSASCGPAHERLYAMHRHRDSRIHERGPEESNDDACTFTPSISRRSHVLAGGDLPKHEKVEDRLLRHGQEHRQRCEEKQDLVKKVDQESRKQQVGPLSRLLNDIAERSGSASRSRYTDPIGVDNEKTAAVIAQKHNKELAFKPYIGINSQELDRQMHGDKKLTWDQRIGNLYYKEQEKENKLQRLRGLQEEEEALRCRASLVAAERKADLSREMELAKMGGGLHARNKAWKQRLENKRRWGKHHKEEEEVRECTFRPTINRSSSLKRSSSLSQAPQHPNGRTNLQQSSYAASPFSAAPLVTERTEAFVSPVSPVSPVAHMPAQDFVVQEMEIEAARHQAIAQHLHETLVATSPGHSVLLSPAKGGRALSLGSEFSEVHEENPDRQDLLRQFEAHRSIMEVEAGRRM